MVNPEKISLPESEFSKSEQERQARVEFVENLASSLHDEWRAPRKIEGTEKYEPRWKDPKDALFSEEWAEKIRQGEKPENIRVNKEGKVEIDIANTPYKELTGAWKAENKASAEIAVEEVSKAVNKGQKFDESFLESASAVIHDKWLERNKSWAPPEQNKPYEELSEEEKAKDREIVEKAIEMHQPKE